MVKLLVIGTLLPGTITNFCLLLQQDCLQTCLEQIEEMVDNMIEERAIAVPNGQNREAAGWTPPPSQDKAHSNAATPTDVRDVHF